MMLSNVRWCWVPDKVRDVVDDDVEWRGTSALANGT